MTCPSCGLALPSEARFCARCGVRQPGVPDGPAQPATAAGAMPATAARGPAGRAAGAPAAPVWLLVLLWLGAAGALWVAAAYGALALRIITPGDLGGGRDAASLQSAAMVISICAASLGLAHGAAAVGLMAGRAWARPFATMVCVVWVLTCVGLPLGVLGISALWRPRRGAGPGDTAPSRPAS